MNKLTINQVYSSFYYNGSDNWKGLCILAIFIYFFLSLITVTQKKNSILHNFKLQLFRKRMGSDSWELNYILRLWSHIVHKKYVCRYTKVSRVQLYFKRVHKYSPKRLTRVQSPNILTYMYRVLQILACTGLIYNNKEQVTRTLGT